MENATRTQLADHLADLLQPIQVNRGFVRESMAVVWLRG